MPAETRADEPAAVRPGVPAETPDGRPAAASPARRRAGHPAHPRRCHLDDGPAIAPAAAQAGACHATVSCMLHDHDGTLLDAGRRHRRPTAALRRAVRERDKGRCQFPGCHDAEITAHTIIPAGLGDQLDLDLAIWACFANARIDEQRAGQQQQQEQGLAA